MDSWGVLIPYLVPVSVCSASHAPSLNSHSTSGRRAQGHRPFTGWDGQGLEAWDPMASEGRAGTWTQACLPPGAQASNLCAVAKAENGQFSVNLALWFLGVSLSQLWWYRSREMRRLDTYLGNKMDAILWLGGWVCGEAGSLANAFSSACFDVGNICSRSGRWGEKGARESLLSGDVFPKHAWWRILPSLSFSLNLTNVSFSSLTITLWYQLFNWQNVLPATAPDIIHVIKMKD